MGKVDFSNYKFRASQCGKLLTGTLVDVSDIENEVQALLEEKMTGENANGNKTKWTDTKERSLVSKQEKLKTAFGGYILPKTMMSELRSIHRQETYNRNFFFDNKYVQKGIQQEDEAITNYMVYRNSKGLKTMFMKNDVRLQNDWFTGEPDLGEHGVEISKWKEGWDTKCSWNLETFPFAEDELDSNYEAQNQVYMDLTGASQWTTVYVLVNGTEQHVNNEKMKAFYSFNQPSEDDKNYPEYEKRCRIIERMMIYDYDRFVDVNPYHDLFYSRDEWFNTVNPQTGLKGLDIPLEDRIIEKVSTYDPKFIEELKNRVKVARKYLNSL